MENMKDVKQNNSKEENSIHNEIFLPLYWSKVTNQSEK